eukprot:gene1584-1750_t
MPSKSEVEATLLIQEVDDLIDENPISPDTIADVDATVTRLSELRSSLRGHNLLFQAENLNKELIDQISTTLVNIKDYIKASKNCKTKISIQQVMQTNDTEARKEKSMLFTIADVRHSLIELINYFKQPIDKLTDAELIQVKTDMTYKVDPVNKIAMKYELILQTRFTNEEPIKDIRIIGEYYEHMTQLRTDFTTNLESLLHERDVYKQKLFAESKLNINLEKFSGSDSTTDFYTFKDNFNKLHERSTPKYLLPDLLKNNFLKGPAFSMVKSLTDIDDIWKQL